jgi:hypothetical protein
MSALRQQILLQKRELGTGKDARNPKPKYKNQNKIQVGG